MLLAATSFAADQNLDEAVRRKQRLPSASFTRAVFENTSSTGYKWQPETLRFSDMSTSREVWRFTYTPTRGSLTQDIGYAHWSADGKRVAFGSDRQTVSRPTATAGDTSWMLANTDGSLLRTGYRLSDNYWNWSNYPAWRPTVRDSLYLPGYSAGGSYNTIYLNTIGDITITKTAAVAVTPTLPRLWLKKGMAADGTKLLFQDFGGPTVWAADLTTGTLDTDGAGYERPLPYDPYWGDLVGTENNWHDNYVAGAAGAENGIWNYALPVTSGDATRYTWWRHRLSGTGTNGEPVHTQDHAAPYLWGGELEPIGGTVSGNDPFSPKADYFSHLAIDRWGKYGIHSKADNLPGGTSLITLGTADYWNVAKVFTGAGFNTGGNNTQHHDWDAWSDWSVSTGSASTFNDYRNHAVAIQNWTDPTSQVAIAYPRTFTSTGGTFTDYNALPRPTQSPDGTKVMFHSDFLNTAVTDQQLYWTVAYNPYPPFISAASATGGVVTITADWDLAGTPRGYTTRGWPNETTDLPPPPREINKFRLWRSTDGTAWTAVKTFDHTVWSNYDFSDGAWTGDDFWSTTDAVADGTYYYGITSLETSGLESQKLSNIKKVVVSGGTGTVTDHAAYPSAPGDKTAFYTTAPDAVQNPAFTYKKSPAVADGQYTVEWTAPVNKTLVRYYNIYAKDGSAPTAIQQTRIASVPATAADTSFSYVDWLGNTDGSTKYIVTAVDFLGNESTAGTPSEGDAIAPVTSHNGASRSATSQTVTLSANETATTAYCIGTAACTPSLPYSAPVSVKPGKFMCYRSTDSAGNAETAKCFNPKFPVLCR